MPKPISIFAVALLAAALLIVGCGGDSSLSKAELIKEADAICLKVNDRNFKGFQAYILKNAKGFSEEASPAETQAALGEGVATVTVPALRKAAGELEALNSSGEEEENVEALVTSLEEATKEAEEEPDSNKATSGLLYNDVHKVARESGFKKCTAIP